MVDLRVKTNWPRRGAWAGILTESPVNATRPIGVNVIAREGLGVASIVARRSAETALSALVWERYGLDLPIVPRAAHSASHTVVWAGPGQWLLIAERKEGFSALSSLAAVSEQSDARAALRLSGPNVRDMLGKGCMIDLHPAAFPAAAAAMTSITHMGVHLWRVDEPPRDEDAAFDILVARSMAASFWSWTKASAAEYGYSITISP